MNVLALDFDGVLCDSAVECAVTAWRAGSQLWPEWQGEEPPAVYLERFIQLRPLVETGYQCIPLMRLLSDGLPDAVIAAQFLQLCTTTLRKIDCSRDQCVQLFSQARDNWLRHDLRDWLSRHRFYPGVMETFVKNLTVVPTFILTTKQERFVKLLLEGQDIDFPEERIYGLDQNQKKEDQLYWLSTRPEYRGATLHFVEDRLATLLRIVEIKDLSLIRLYLADWGYNTDSERQRARRDPRITIWSTDRFMTV